MPIQRLSFKQEKATKMQYYTILYYIILYIYIYMQEFDVIRWNVLN